MKKSARIDFVELVTCHALVLGWFFLPLGRHNKIKDFGEILCHPIYCFIKLDYLPEQITDLIRL